MPSVSIDSKADFRLNSLLDSSVVLDALRKSSSNTYFYLRRNSVARNSAKIQLLPCPQLQRNSAQLNGASGSKHCAQFRAIARNGIAIGNPTFEPTNCFKTFKPAVEIFQKMQEKKFISLLQIHQTKVLMQDKLIAVMYTLRTN